MEDIHLSDQSKWADFYNAMNGGNVALANSIINANPSLKNKIFNAMNMNIMIDDILYLEKLPKEDIDDFLQQLLVNMQLKIDNLKFIGVFDMVNQYFQHNVVEYNNLFYYAKKQPPLGVYPTNTNYWLSLDLQGKTGAMGTGLNLRFAWNSNVHYEPKDAVSFGGELWVAKKVNIGVPPADGETWLLAVDTPPQAVIKVYTSRPPFKYDYLCGQFLCGQVVCGQGEDGLPRGTIWMLQEEEIN